MGVTTYYSVGGEIIGERSGGVRTDYLRDALGSVTATKRTDRGTISNTYRYKPYGERLAKTGVAADPRFQWVGTAGYRETAMSHSKSYVRARHYGQEEGRWTTVDPLQGWVVPYQYALACPSVWIDPSGLIAICSDPAQCTPSVSISLRTKKCEVTKHKTKPNVLLVRVFKFMDINCSLSCPTVKCGSCSMTQFATELEKVQGYTVLDRKDDHDWQLNSSCPGVIKRTDAPGIHSGRVRGPGGILPGPGSIQPVEEPDTLPIEYFAKYRVRCYCSEDKVDEKFYRMHIKIYRNKQGVIQCELS